MQSAQQQGRSSECGIRNSELKTQTGCFLPGLGQFGLQMEYWKTASY